MNRFLHRFADGLEPVVRQILQKAGPDLSLRRADLALMVFKLGDRAEFWLYKAAVTLTCTVRRAVQMATVVLAHDIADITAMNFLWFAIDPTDEALCLFREGGDLAWRLTSIPTGTWTRRLSRRPWGDSTGYFDTARCTERWRI
jgi:hypothetical protein